MRFRKKPIVIDAVQWFKNGDHPDDACVLIGAELGETFLTEGQVVRYYRRPGDAGDRKCEHCGIQMHDHGWIDTKEGGHIVCPGDWIIMGIARERYPCKPEIFIATYEAVE